MTSYSVTIYEEIQKGLKEKKATPESSEWAYVWQKASEIYDAHPYLDQVLSREERGRYFFDDTFFNPLRQKWFRKDAKDAKDVNTRRVNDCLKRFDLEKHHHRQTFARHLCEHLNYNGDQGSESSFLRQCLDKFEIKVFEFVDHKSEIRAIAKSLDDWWFSIAAIGVNLTAQKEEYQQSILDYRRWWNRMIDTVKHLKEMDEILKRQNEIDALKSVDDRQQKISNLAQDFCSYVCAAMNVKVGAQVSTEEQKFPEQRSIETQMWKTQTPMDQQVMEAWFDKINGRNQAAEKNESNNTKAVIN